VNHSLFLFLFGTFFIFVVGHGCPQFVEDKKAPGEKSQTTADNPRNEGPAIGLGAGICLGRGQESFDGEGDDHHDVDTDLLPQNKNKKRIFTRKFLLFFGNVFYRYLCCTPFYKSM
jgi:hypothetical protein